MTPEEAQMKLNKSGCIGQIQVPISFTKKEQRPNGYTDEEWLSRIYYIELLMVVHVLYRL